MAPGITVPGKILMTRGIEPLLMMHVPCHHPRGHKLPVYDHRLPVRSVRLQVYSVRSHPVRRLPLYIVLHLRDTRLLLLYGDREYPRWMMVLDPVTSSLAPPRWSQASQEAAILLHRGLLYTDTILSLIKP